MRADPARAEALAHLLSTPLGRVEHAERRPGAAAARAREIVAGVRRHVFTLDAILGTYVPNHIARVEPRLLEALHIGLFQILYERQVAKPLVVASTVALAGPSSKKRGFLNAVLRRIAGDVREESADLPRRQRDCVIVGHRASVRFPMAVLPDPEEDLVAHLSVHFSLTPWFVETVLRDVGEEVDDLLLALTLPLPLALRVNRLRTSPELAEAALSSAGASVQKRFGDVLEVRLSGSIADCPPFRDGLVTVQDVVASEVAPFVDPKPGERILDLCAGAGGKATHLAELALGQAAVVATDVSAQKLAMLEENLARLGTPGVQVLLLDEGTLSAMPPFDRVLVDVPCSNSGVLMKRIAARYRLNPDAASALARKQLELLRRGASCLRPGGVLVYSTCSILAQENGAVVERFLGDQSGSFTLDEVRLSYPHKTGRDGGYMARLRRQA